jgi:integrase/recombinase XerD
MSTTPGLAKFEARSAATVRAYVRDTGWWAAWCAHAGLDPTHASALHADAYAAALAAAGLARATQVRRLAAASSWITALIRAQAADHNPFAGQDRPAVDEHNGGARSLSQHQVDALIRAAATYGHHRTRTRTRALIALAIVTLARSSSLRALDIGDLGTDAGHDTVDLTVKGGRRVRVPLPAFAKGPLGAYLAERGPRPGPLFATATGKPLAASQVFKLVRRVAQAAGIDGITPHSLRATGITLLIDAGVPLELIAELAAHRDVRTTKGYDRKPGRRLGRSPAYQLGEMFDHA